jgi:hypothetical protein
MRLHNPSTSGGFNIESVTLWEPAPSRSTIRIIPPPTLFSQQYFLAHEQYPDGVADMVGYWAEDRILGGVALFDHSQAWGENDEPNVYFHTGRARTTFFIYQLLNEQQEALLDFLLAENPEDSFDSLFPILPSSDNRVRISPEDATPVYKVYRDAWERSAPREVSRRRRYLEPCDPSPLDYPDLPDIDEEMRRTNRVLEEYDARNGRNA